MSVLVKGMDMPECCGACKLSSQISMSLGSVLRCRIVGHVGASSYDPHDVLNKRHPDCPLVALPDKHGRLVEFIDVATTLDEDSGTEEVCVGDVMRAYCEMRNAPTIVEAEDEQ